jgi:hypothetical protein
VKKFSVIRRKKEEKSLLISCKYALQSGLEGQKGLILPQVKKFSSQKSERNKRKLSPF